MSAPTRGVPPRRNLKADIAEYLREQIFAGGLRPGSKIDQDGLAEQLGVSKLPVREALITLEAEGLLHSAPRRGSYVASLTEDDVRDHFRIFGAISALAAEVAAERLTEEQFARLDELVTQMRSGGDFDAVRDLNDAFHREIHMAASKRIRGALKLLASTMPSRFYEFAEDWEVSAHSEHEEMVAALRARDAAWAARATITHFCRNGDLAVALLRESGFWEEASEGGRAE